MQDFGNSVAIVLALGALSSCTGTDTIQTSADTAIIQTRAAPICGSGGAARSAQKQAAIETLRSGYDSYIIYGAEASNDVHATQMPGSYNTIGNIGPSGSFNATSTYTPGATIVHGSHRQSFAIKMFHRGEAGAEKAISARETLGPDWQKKMKEGSLGVCF